MTVLTLSHWEYLRLEVEFKPLSQMEKEMRLFDSIFLWEHVQGSTLKNKN